MTCDLFIADRLYSSWSLRGWLLFRAFGLPFNENLVGLYAGTMSEDMKPVAPARLVPAIKTADGTTVGESVAIAETLAELYPDAGLWPSDPAQRATARWLASEMAAGFGALRGDCPMQLLSVYSGFQPSDAVRKDLARLNTLWSHARTMAGTSSGWLFGEISAADVFFAPVAARVVGYNLPVTKMVRVYCDHWLANEHFKEWRKMGLAEAMQHNPYPIDLPKLPWPGDAD